jgi:curved DNA-binding protein
MISPSADYYEILGVAPDADSDQIQRAYRRRAREHHPDVSSRPGAEEQFKEISEAYAVLSDPQRRRRYDAARSGRGRNPASARSWTRAGRGTEWAPPGGGDGSPFPDDLFGDFLRRRHVFDSRRPVPGADQEVQLEVTIEEAYQGGGRTITLDDTVRIDLQIPAGVTDGHRILLPGQGGWGTPPGDLYLIIRLAPHPRYRVEGRDVHVELPVTPWEAALGASIPLRLPGRLTQVTIPPGTSGRQPLRLAGYGLPRPHGLPGDVYVDVTIVVPAELTEEERSLFGRLAARSHFNPRRSQ